MSMVDVDFEDLYEIDKDVLWFFCKQKKKVSCSYPLLNDEELRLKYTDAQLDHSAQKLHNSGYLKYSKSMGSISGPESIGQLKKQFQGKLLVFKLYEGIKIFWSFFWKHFLITIITAALTTIITLWLTDIF